MFRRLRRGCSLEVIFEEEDCTPFSQLAQPAQDHCSSSPETRPQRVRKKTSPGFIAVYKRRRSRSLSAVSDSVLTEDPNWDIANSTDKEDTEWDHRRAPLSRRHIIERNSFEDLAAWLDPQPPELDLSAHELPSSPPAVIKEPEPSSADSHYECNIRSDFLIHCPCGSGRVVFKMVLTSNMPLQHMQAIPESETLSELTGGTAGGPAKRRTSIYEALAMANQVSQGSMTRRYRQFFEEQSHRAQDNKSALDVHPRPVLNQPITEAPVAIIKEHEPHKMASQPSVHKKTPDPPSWPPAKDGVITAPEKKKTPVASEPKAKDVSSSGNGHHSGLRCEMCSAPIQTRRDKPEATLPQKASEPDVPSVEECDPSATQLACKPTNKEVVDDELPRPNTVKNVRNLFETDSDTTLPHPYGTFRPASANAGRFSMGYVKSNPSSKILRSESLSSLNQLPHYHLSRSSSTLSLHNSQAHAVLLTLPKEDMEPLEEKGYVVALGRLAPLRSLSRHEREAVFRSPSPPPYRSGAGAPHAHRSLRASHSIPAEFTSRSYVDSIFSEASEWSSDWDNHSDTASSASVSSPRPGSTSHSNTEGVRYIAPDVLERIRSYGLTFQFVDGKMVSSDHDDPEYAPVPAPLTQKKSGTPASKPQVAATKSAAPQAKKNGSALTPNLKSPKSTLGKTVSAPLPATPATLDKFSSTTQPRVISYVPKASTPFPVVTTTATTTFERVRHCSGDSSASSSGVSSVAQRSDSGSSESDSVGGSPFCSLKRVKKRESTTKNDRAFFERDGRCSPGPVDCPSVKSAAESTYGMYSVMYNFQHSQVTPHVKV